MTTIFDILSVAVFVVLAIAYLERSVSEAARPIPLWRYGLIATGCAAANYLGNRGDVLLASAILLAAVVSTALTVWPNGRASTK